MYHPLWGLSFLPGHFVNSKSSVHEFGLPWRGEDLEYCLFTCKKSMFQQLEYTAGYQCDDLFPPPPLSPSPLIVNPTWGQMLRKQTSVDRGGGEVVLLLKWKNATREGPHDQSPPTNIPDTVQLQLREDIFKVRALAS